MGGFHGPTPDWMHFFYSSFTKLFKLLNYANVTKLIDSIDQYSKNIARSQKAALSTSHRLLIVSSCSHQMTFVKKGLKCEFVLLSFDTIIVLELSR